MRILVLSAGLIVAGLLVANAAELNEPAASEGGVATDESRPSRATRLDELFLRLQTADEENAAKEAERSIVALWLESGSDTVDLLMRRTLAEIEDKNYALALDYLDRIVTLKPDYAEGWNKRATVHFLKDDYAKSVADIERVLALEPRHFGALSGLGMILHDIGDEQRAIEAFESALAVNPRLEGARKSLDEIKGRGDKAI